MKASVTITTSSIKHYGTFDWPEVHIRLEAENPADLAILKMAEHQTIECLTLDENNPNCADITIQLPSHS
jgi:hypothetical protein